MVAAEMDYTWHDILSLRALCYCVLGSMIFIVKPMTMQCTTLLMARLGQISAYYTKNSRTNHDSDWDVMLRLVSGVCDILSYIAQKDSTRYTSNHECAWLTLLTLS